MLNDLLTKCLLALEWLFCVHSNAIEDEGGSVVAGVVSLLRSMVLGWNGRRTRPILCVLIPD